MESEDLAPVAVLFIIAASIKFAEDIRKLNQWVIELPEKLLNIIIEPIFIISTIVFSTGLFVGINIFRRHRDEKRRQKEGERAEHWKRHDEREKKRRELYDPKYFTYESDEEEPEEENEEPEIVEQEYSDSFENKPRREVNIRVDESKRYFHKKRLSRDEVNFLLDEDYQIKKYKNLLTDEMEDFLLKPRHNEGYTHLFLTKNVNLVFTVFNLVKLLAPFLLDSAVLIPSSMSSRYFRIISEFCLERSGIPPKSRTLFFQRIHDSL